MIAFTVLYTALLLGQVQEGYVWPLEQPRALTSSFAEYRSDRFHMGIDLRTGPIGKKVLVAGDGYVSRIRCSPYGYGKAIYVQLDDGNTAIYAHLSDFIPSLNDYVRETQHRQEAYTVDLYPETTAFRVQGGQTIGYSGQTGIGVPHLHWEIRDSSGVPINPRTLGLTWPDTTAPHFRKVLLIPLTPETTINGDYLPVALSVKRTESGDYRAASVRVRGRVAVGVDVYDPANGGGSKLGVYRVSTTVDGDAVFGMTHDRVSYAHAGDGAVAYHPFYLESGHFLLQWPWPGVQTELYAKSQGTGEIEVTDRAREVRVEAVDFFDHGRGLTLELTPDAPGSVPPPTGAEIDRGTGSVFYNVVGDNLLVSVQFTTPESMSPRLLESGVESSIGFTRVSATTYRACFRADANRSVVGLSIDHPRAGRDAQTQLPLEHRFALVHTQGKGMEEVLGDFRVRIQPEQVYRPLFVALAQSPAVETQDLSSQGDAYHLWPESAPFRKAVEGSIALPPGEKKGWGIYRNSGKEWSWVASEKRGGRLHFRTQKLGTFQLMQDSTKPMIRFVSPKAFGVKSARPSLRIAIEDTGSGVASWEVRYRDAWLLMAYDPEQELLIWERDTALPSGPGTLVVSVKDRAGNVGTRELSITVP